MNTAFSLKSLPDMAFVQTTCPFTGRVQTLSANCSVRQLAIWLKRADTAQDAVQIAQNRFTTARKLLPALRHARAMRAYQLSLAN